jgi:hypothetical protein
LHPLSLAGRNSGAAGSRSYAKGMQSPSPYSLQPLHPPDLRTLPGEKP